MVLPESTVLVFDLRNWGQLRKFQAGYSITGPTFEPGTCRIKFQIVTAAPSCLVYNIIHYLSPPSNSFLVHNYLVIHLTQLINLRHISTPSSYSLGTVLKSRPGDLLVCLGFLVFFFSLSWQMPE